MIEFLCKELGISVILEEKVCQKIEEIVQRKNSIETGGIIIGYYTVSLQKAIITELSDAPIDSKAGYNWFYRGIKGLKRMLADKWTKRGEYYLGEWHLHPNSSPNPSIIDIKQIKSNARNKEFNCPEPVLLIIGGNSLAVKISVTLLFEGKIYSLKEISESHELTEPATLM